MLPEQVEHVEERLASDAEVIMDEPEQFNFRDRYGIYWQLVPPGTEFLVNGEVHGQWLQL